MKTFRLMLWVACCLGLIGALPAKADVRLPGVFTDNMILQWDKPIVIWGWAEPGEAVTVQLQRTDSAQVELSGAQTDADENGAWEVTLPKRPTGGVWTLTVKGANALELSDILFGDVWLCSGQSNMQWTVKGSSKENQEYAAVELPDVRMFTVARAVKIAPSDEVKGMWTKAAPETVNSMSAVGYFFGRALHEHLKVPIGLISSNWGGTRIETWMTPEALAEVPGGKEEIEKRRQANDAFDLEAAQAELEKRLDTWKKQMADWKAKKEAGEKVGRQPRKPGIRSPHRNQQAANHLYFGMIHPFIKLRIRGVIWYQGESNANRGNAANYRNQLPKLVTGWRKAFAEPELPFFWVQLPGWQRGGNWPEVREGMRLAREVPYADMAIALGLGHPTNIHPPHKREVADRLALVARHIAYGEKDLIWQGPIYKSVTFKDGKAVLEFDHVGEGLKLEPQEKPGFEVAGEDGNFVPAEATLEGDRVVVSSEQVPDPKVVRYGWSAMPPVWLSNSAGLPASPFRTSD